MTARRRWIVLGFLVLVGLFFPLASFVRSMWVTRQAVGAYTRLIAAANVQDLRAVRAECSERYLRTHPIEVAEGGGVVLLPRNIHRNFRAWCEGTEVWLCPTDRQGPVYRFVAERNGYRFDGPAGLLRGGRVEPIEPEEEEIDPRKNL